MPKVTRGETFPKLCVNTLYEGQQTITDLFTAKTNILWCLRYIGCTVCRYDIHVAAQRYEEIKAKDAKIIFMLQSDKALLQEELKALPLPFDIICDPEMKLYEELEIQPAESMEALLGGKIEKLKAKGAAATAAGFSHGKYEGNEQQLPAMFIIDENGVVKEAIYAETIVGLPTFDELLEKLN